MSKEDQFITDMKSMISGVSDVLARLDQIERLRKDAIIKVFPKLVQEKNPHYSEYRISILKRDLLKMQGALAKAKRHAQRADKLKTNVSLLLYEVERDQAA